MKATLAVVLVIMFLRSIVGISNVIAKVSKNSGSGSDSGSSSSGDSDKGLTDYILTS